MMGAVSRRRVATADSPTPTQTSAEPEPAVPVAPYLFTGNDPFDRSAPIRHVVPKLLSSDEFMQSVRAFPVPADAFAVWFLGQNGFLLRDSTGPLVAVDAYLSNSCAATFAHLPFRLDRQLPVFIEPEDLDVDIFLCTHSHQDHADPETIARLRLTRDTLFVGPWDVQPIFTRCGVRDSHRRLLHPGETIDLGGGTRLTATFALPTDATDLNHTGALVEFANGLRFFNTGDTAWAERLPALLPTDVDVCAICINGGFHNLAPAQAAFVISALRPRVAVPCHYDLMVNNVGSPAMFHAALLLAGAKSAFHQLRYYEPWIYRRADFPNITDSTT